MNDPTGPSRLRSPRDWVNATILSCGGLGYAPVASGTFGTLAGIALVLAMLPFRDAEWFHFGVMMIVAAAACVGVGVLLGKWAEGHYGRKDPGQVVLDEVGGYCICLFRLEGFPSLKEIVIAFFVFRLFDVVKPPPGRRIEKLPQGWGIMLDDIIAGIYGLMLISVLRDYLEWGEWAGWVW